MSHEGSLEQVGDQLSPRCAIPSAQDPASASDKAVELRPPHPDRAKRGRPRARSLRRLMVSRLVRAVGAAKPAAQAPTEKQRRAARFVAGARATPPRCARAARCIGARRSARGARPRTEKRSGTRRFGLRPGSRAGSFDARRASCSRNAPATNSNGRSLAAMSASLKERARGAPAAKAPWTPEAAPHARRSRGARGPRLRQGAPPSAFRAVMRSREPSGARRGGAATPSSSARACARMWQ